MEESVDLQDWELLHGSDSELVISPVSAQKLSELEGIEGDSEGMIRSDYFSLDSQGRYERPVDVSEEGSIESDNPSWIDPGLETRYERKDMGEFWSDSGSDRSDERKIVDFDAKNELGLGETEKTKVGFEGESENLRKLWSDERKSSDFDVKNELGLVETGKSQVGFEGIGEIGGESENMGKFGFGLGSDLSDDRKISDFDAQNQLNFVESGKSQAGFEEIGEIGGESENLGKFWSDSGGIGSMENQLGKFEEENKEGVDGGGKKRDVSELSGESDGGNESKVEMEGGGDQNDNENVGAIKEVESKGDKELKRRVVWWKVPLEFFRYCAFRVSPVWSFSVAAAILGIVILGRRLYRMKRKSRSLQLKVTVDDKKVSQFMSRAARLNEAFSVVRRVPIIRPALPAAGVNPWPVMSLR
ncbi:hypothetical protein VitviT2T_029191 [Vitis vinifera]|uniref:DUF6821 domain-containing protein n=2 Tax=Vitis vinifera TaxID=29760 RepID=A0ABY9DVZ0_VITVI|nr:uncharacterized protein LOC100241424 [Vitis vinifera]WKA11718.1 hypothetical protein VitviT2T_029191 [Vitis vinifera]|eukprot:XP_002274203.1 PREDICTED: uncharacterized protein LOC100241424 [Vitis vinifera]